MLRFNGLVNRIGGQQMRANLFWFSDGQWARIEPRRWPNLLSRRNEWPSTHDRCLGQLGHMPTVPVSQIDNSKAQRLEGVATRRVTSGTVGTGTHGLHDAQMVDDVSRVGMAIDERSARVQVAPA